MGSKLLQLRGFLASLLLVSMCTPYVSSLDCSNVISEYSAGVLNWLGEVSFKVPRSTTTGWSMGLQFDVAYTGVGAWDVWVNNDGHAEGKCVFMNRDENAQLTAGQNLFFRFRVNWFTNVTKPKATSLTFEGIQLCNP